jgi:poly(U)-specific endoribonuclease
MADIYEQIWNLPSSHVKVTKCDATGSPLDATADVALDEQGKAGGSMSIDNAGRPLIPFVKAGLLAEPTFATLIALLDDYNVVEGEAEPAITGTPHGTSVDAFLDAILPTAPMQLAKTHIQATFDSTLTDATFRAAVKKMWFEPYTNHFSGSDPFCVGFEHVFVGESTRKPSDGPSDDNVGGYHSWVKFFIDEQAGKVNYLGHDYRPAITADGLADSNVASVLMTWKPTAAEGGDGNTLFKKPGGFFVGTRPECEFALGTVGIFAVLNNAFDNTPGSGSEDHRRVVLGSNAYFLVCHPETITPAGGGGSPRVNGPHLRTLYAKFLGSATAPTGGGTPGGTTPSTGSHLPSNPHNDASIRIRSALPNPVGASDDGEYVEIKNVSAFSFDLSEWALADVANRKLPLTGTLAPGAILKVMMVRTDSNSMMLRNSPGWILLYQGDIRRAAVKYTNTAEGAVTDFDLT